MGQPSRKLKGMAVAAFVVIASSAVFFLTHAKNNSQPVVTPVATTTTPTTQTTTPAPTAVAQTTAPAVAAPVDPWQTYNVKAGDTLSKIFTKLNFSAADLAKVQKLKLKHLKTLRSGEVISYLVQNKQLVAIKYDLSFEQYAEINLQNAKAKLEIKDKPVTTTLEFKSGVVRHSLRDAASRAGLTHNMLVQLQHIYGGTLNFARDIHPGDKFAILYNEYYVDGKKYKTGDIVAAQFHLGGKKFDAIRFTYAQDHVGYFTPTGQALQPLFLSFPVHFLYISSHFAYHRFDPYLHSWHPHLGVDFAADRGTPVESIGNGRLVFIGHDGGYGNCIKVRYGNHYEALYGHLSAFAKHLRLNEFIHKGQIIGYVGSTGWSTGPHLHFSFFVNGIPFNWLSFHMPHANSIPRGYDGQFKSTANHLLNTLALYQHES